MIKQTEELKAQQLIKRLRDFQRFYIKGFGHRLALVNANSGYRMRNPQSTSLNDETLQTLDILESAYARLPQEIPFDYDFAPVILTRRMMPELGQNVRRFFSSPEYDTLTTIREDILTIGNIGDRFRISFSTAFQELRKQPGFENYSFQLTDLDGKVWTYSAGEV